jgi:hypothetical protein
MRVWAASRLRRRARCGIARRIRDASRLAFVARWVRAKDGFRRSLNFLVDVHGDLRLANASR